MFNAFDYFKSLKSIYGSEYADAYFDLWMDFWLSCGDSKLHCLDEHYLRIFKKHYYE